MIFGIGINDLTSKLPSYSTWYSMHRRCYSELYDKNHGGYSECEVSKEWQILSNYNNWFNENYIQGYDLDKDLISNSKIYSEDTCIFLPREINSALQQDKNKNGLPPGVSYKASHGKYVSQISKTRNSVRKNIHICINKDIDYCFNLYKIEKEKYIKELAEEFKSKIDSKTYNLLINYEVKIK